MGGMQGEDVVEGDSAEGVPEEESADEKAGNGLQKVAATGGRGGGAHAGTRRSGLSQGRWEITQYSDWSERQ